MRVICVLDVHCDYQGSCKDLNIPKVGEIYVVINCTYLDEVRIELPDVIYSEPSGIYYSLRGFKDKYHASAFATLPDADADQMQEEVRESIVNLEDGI